MTREEVEQKMGDRYVGGSRHAKYTSWFIDANYNMEVTESSIILRPRPYGNGHKRRFALKKVIDIICDNVSWKETKLAVRTDDGEYHWF